MAQPELVIPAGTEVFEAEIPEGLRPEDLAPARAPSGEAKPEQPVEAVRPAAKRGPSKADRILQEVERLRERGTSPVPPTSVPFQAPPTDAQRRLKHREIVSTADDMGLVFDTIAAEVEARSTEIARKAVLDSDQARQLRQEASVRSKHNDYDELLREFGIFEGIKPLGAGRYVNQEMADTIYGSDNVAQAAYDLALDLKNAKSGIAPPAKDTRTPEPGTLESPTPQPVARPRSISALPSSGDGTMTVTREGLTQLGERNPEALRKLLARNPDMNRFYLGG